MAAATYADALARVLTHEGGNDDDPRDPGGRTSRGIIQREWDTWRMTHPGLPADVWQAPDSQVAAIYRQKYWDAMRCDDLPRGVDYAVFDYGVNSGISRSAKVLQKLVGAPVDGEIGPDTITAAAKARATVLINQICDERLTFLQGLGTWGTFGRGWGRRVAEVRAAALAMAATPAGGKVSADVPAPAQNKGATGWLWALLEALFGRAGPTLAGAPKNAPAAPKTATLTGAKILAFAESCIGKFQDGPDVPNLAKSIAAAFPDDWALAAYCKQATNTMPWCGDFVGYVMAHFGIKPPPEENGIGFFYVDAWKRFGTPVAPGQEQPGDVVMFIYPGALHHVTLWAGNGFYVGGNQADAVTKTRFGKTPSAVRRAPGVL